MVLRDLPGGRRSRLRTYGVAGAILALIALLATLQYRWLGQISDAERDRLKATLATRAGEFAQDVDQELARAYLLFQVADSGKEGDLAADLGERYGRWNATSRFPRLIKDVYFARSGDRSAIARFDPFARTLTAAAWPAALETVHRRLATMVERTAASDGRPLFVHTIAAPVDEEGPAILIPTQFLLTDPARLPIDLPDRASASAIVLLLDRDYLTRELLPALAQRHLRSGGLDYEVAVLRAATGEILYRSDARFAPKVDERGDASVDLLQVRTQDFASLAGEVQRYTAFASAGAGRTVVRQVMTTAATTAALAGKLEPNVSVVIQEKPAGGAGPGGRGFSFIGTISRSPRWKLIVEHPSGSLERAVAQARRRSLAISTSILGVLGLSLGFLVVSTRRAHDLARQQMDFVATVSHELRTPLAVIRSAADNLADGVVDDDARIRQYGELVRTEGRRLSDLVEQILEFAGLQSGQRAIAATPVAIGELLREVVATGEAVAAPAGVRIELTVADPLPPVRGDPAALRRVLQNLVGNAIKYGADGQWVGVTARATNSAVEIAIADRGIGIAAADQLRIFEPFYRAPEAVHAQIQGAGLGLSLVSRIVAAHGGHISVKSAPGSGSTFTVALPAATGQP